MTGGSKELIFAPGSETAAIEEDGNATVLHIPMPLILGPARERIFRGESVRKVGDFHLVDGGGFLAGACVAPATLGPREAAAYLYDALFAIIGGRPLCRIWNYVPRINDCDSGEENYREFNAGRLDAFLRHYGEEFRPVFLRHLRSERRAARWRLRFLPAQMCPNTLRTRSRCRRAIIRGTTVCSLRHFRAGHG